ncbi:MAG TPA: GDSL-type esterase/lipase family protein [Streptosporangiaceae bacterium]|nr:GDSL-type esterase/lipase family protein [Streptosporangiaceae bacterium]
MSRSGLPHFGTAQRGRRHAAALAVAAVALAVCQLAPAGAAGAATAGVSSAAAQPAPCPPVSGQPSGGSVRIMIVGDSISEGSSGDYTWQYRLYEHLRADGVSPQMVGPYNWLFNNVTNVDGDCSYADPRFEHAHDARWGMTLLSEKGAIGGKVATYRPSYLLVLLGLDDIFWYGVSQPGMAANLKSFIAAARAARPRIRIVLGLIPPDIHQQTDPAFAASIASYNQTISSTAAQLSTIASPIAVAQDGTGINVAADLWDGTHPNANGEVKIAAGFADVLASRFHLGGAYPTPFPVLPTGPLTQPQLTVRPSGTAGQAVLSWTLSPGAEGYYVYLRDVTRGETAFTQLPWPLSPTQDPWTAGLLTTGDTYAFKLQACKGVDCGAFSNVATVTAP